MSGDDQPVRKLTTGKDAAMNGWIVTALLNFSFLASGFNFSILSPTIYHLASAYSTDLVGIADVFTSRSVGYLIGALSGCLVFRYVDRELCLSLMYMLIAAALLIVSLIHNLTAAIILIGIQGLCTGVCDSATNLIICQTWKGKASPYIQSLYFFFGLGCTIAPLVTAPFMFGGQFRIPYYITSAILFVAGAALLPLAFVKRRYEEREERAVTEPIQVEEQSGEKTTRLKKLMEWCSKKDNYSTAIVVSLLAVMIMSYSGMEIVYWEFISAYLMSIKNLNILPEQASYMTAAVNYTFTLMRGLAIFVVWKVKPQLVLLINLVVLVIACSLLLYSDSLTTVWIGNILIGAAFSTVYPQIYAYAVSRVTMTSYIASLMVFSSGLLAVFYPKLVARQLKHNPNFIIWLVLISISVTSAAFLALILLSRAFTNHSRILVVENEYEIHPHVTRM